MSNLHSQFFFYGIILLLPLLLFLWLIRKKTTSLWVGALAFYLCAAISGAILVGLNEISSTLMYAILIPLALIFIFFSFFGIFAMIIALFWNEKVLLKYERKSLANMLPLILGSVLLALSIGDFIVNVYLSKTWVATPFSFILTVASYFALVFFFFSLTALLFNILPIRGKIDYIIVLGAGLNKDKVTPLLAARIDKGVALYYKQRQKGHQPSLIVSGGQGSDELVSEAFAMKHYIQENYPDIQTILLEDKSTNTRENILFSEKVAQKNGETRPFAKCRIVLATNNYHLLRAGKIAHHEGINVQGVGAKTRLFYLPTAFIREYIGYLVLSKKKHLIVTGFIFFTTIGMELLNYFLTKFI